MKFLLMCYFSEDLWGSIPETQRNDILNEYNNVIQDTVKSGQLCDGGRLAQSRTATTVRRQNGKPVITDGPFAETKEQLGGYHLLECKDLNEAISIALRIPTLPLGGTIEVRAVAVH